MEPPIVKYVENLTELEKVEIIHDWDKFEQDGFIGECTMRTKAAQFLNDNTWPEGMIIIAMQGLVFEVCRQFAAEYLRDNGLDNS